MNFTKAHIVSLCLGLVLAACGDDQGSSPVPQPVPDFVRQSTPGLTQSKKLVLGLPGAVAGKGKVHLTDKATGTKVVGDSAAAGSFALVIAIDATKTNELQLQYENEDGLSDPISLATRQLTYGPALGQTKGSLVKPSGTPGEVEINNDGGAGNPLLLDASPDMTLIVTVVSTAQVVSTPTDSTGRFSVKVNAGSGDAIQLLLVDPADPGSSSDFVVVTVP
jgi:hypothetical protein